MSKIFLFIFHLLSRLPPLLDGGSFLEVGVGLAPCGIKLVDATWGYLVPDSILLVKPKLLDEEVVFILVLDPGRGNSSACPSLAGHWILILRCYCSTSLGAFLGSNG